ncbi:hypothetical protein NC652_003704 [Populus alba x Populus x berolinensis]|uniref:Uncharacterized protein n=1 Tax=Populus alba x Populus x berolinensis TaxID=444605 RepID=A0AAD6WIN9_9ROSI|nr:hypothetical protein NC652_003704 [Populus alba x Populus x berolinensis]KAJ7014225.1 hypothetical protein NC653_003741 [Populus alba x Populus x berolinensis]
MNDGEIEPCIAYIRDSNGAKNYTVSPEADMINKIDSHGHSEASNNQNGDVEEDEWVGNSSVSSVNKNSWENNVSGSAIEWEENACDENPEVFWRLASRLLLDNVIAL